MVGVTNVTPTRHAIYLGLMEDDTASIAKQMPLTTLLATATQLNKKPATYRPEADYPATALGRILRQHINFRFA